MALIRRFEEEAGRQYQQAKAGGFLHLAIGEEATIVGTTSVMRREDYLIGTYRTHGHAIARGTDPKRVMAELFGREDGMLARPRRLDAHLRPRAPVHGRLRDRRRQPAARRRARAGLRLPGDDAVTVCMFGDGASNTGNFGETMNLAALWKLPVVFLVENNLYGMGTAIERHSARHRPLAQGGGPRACPASASTAWTCWRCARPSPSTSGSRARTASRPWSRPSPTASAATPPPTPRSTGPRRRSRSGARRTRSRSFATASLAEGVIAED